MKKLLILLAISFSINVNAQTQKDTVLPNAIQIIPIVVTAQGDTANQFSWYAFNVQRDTLSGCNTNVTLYSRKGKKLYNYNQIIPSSVLNQWNKDPQPIDDYIILQNQRLARKPE
jgi:hypothetical protein